MDTNKHVPQSTVLRLSRRTRSRGRPRSPDGDYEHGHRGLTPGFPWLERIQWKRSV